MIEDFKLLGIFKFALARNHRPPQEGDGKGQKANRGHAKNLHAMLWFLFRRLFLSDYLGQIHVDPMPCSPLTAIKRTSNKLGYQLSSIKFVSAYQNYFS